MERKGCCCNFVEKAKPYIAMTCLQFGYAGMNIITKVSLTRGMSHYVLVVYRHAFATALISPFALLLERKVRPKMTFRIFMQLFVLGLLGPVIDQNLYYAGLKLTSTTFSCAMSTNMLPAVTFLMAIISRMEKVEIKKSRCQAKVIGIVVITVGGGMAMTVLYKGHVINDDDEDWFRGSILLILATLAWAAFFILQANTLRKYRAEMSLTAIVCFLGTLQSIAATFVMERESDAWAIGWDINLLAAAYAGIISSSIAYYVQGIVMQKKGPVFVAAFSPVTMIIVAIVGLFILAETFYVVGVVGAVLIVIGLFSVLWGKYKEQKEEEDDEANEIQESVKGGNHQKNAIMIKDQDIEANNNNGRLVEIMKKNEAHNIVVVPAPKP